MANEDLKKKYLEGSKRAEAVNEGKALPPRVSGPARKPPHSTGENRHVSSVMSSERQSRPQVVVSPNKKKKNRGCLRLTIVLCGIAFGIFLFVGWLGFYFGDEDSVGSPSANGSELVGNVSSETRAIDAESEEEVPGGEMTVTERPRLLSIAALVGEPSLGSSIDLRTLRITHEANVFTSAEKIYLSVPTKEGGSSHALTAKWSYLDSGGYVPVHEESQQVQFDTGRVNLFEISNPQPWPSGDYKVDVQVDGQAVRSLSYSIIESLGSVPVAVPTIEGAQSELAAVSVRCTRELTPLRQALCLEPNLAALAAKESELNSLWQRQTKDVWQADRERGQWQGGVGLCGSELVCLTEAYQARIDELSAKLN